MNKEQILNNIRWYEEQASSMARYASQDPPLVNGMTAITQSMSLDAGQKATATIEALEDLFGKLDKIMAIQGPSVNILEIKEILQG